MELWYVTLQDRYYVCAEMGETAHWVQNIRRSPEVSVVVGGTTRRGRARVVEDAQEPALAASVRRAFQQKYGWGDGLPVEIQPLQDSAP